jgi:lipid-binding SYLF domain-containing protein
MRKSIVVTMLALSLAACGGAPKTATGRMNLEQSAQATLSEMQARDPSLPGMLASAYAYAVFPSIGKGGLIVGGAFGRGILYERGRPSGYVELSQASLGALLGGQTFAELIVLRDPEDVRDIKAGTFDVGAHASVVALTAGAARAADIGPDRNPVFVLPRGGLMVDLSISGQRLDYRPFLDPAAG